MKIHPTATGTVSQLVKSKGFGFIRCAGGRELYFNQSHVQDVAFDSLKLGQNIVFRVAPGVKGLQAIGVKPLLNKSKRQI